MKDRAVAGPQLEKLTSKETPAALMSCVKNSPSWSSRTFPMKDARPPKDATPAAVFAAEPPEMTTDGPI
jgi:hypothetical protein